MGKGANTVQTLKRVLLAVILSRNTSGVKQKLQSSAKKRFKSLSEAFVFVTFVLYPLKQFKQGIPYIVPLRRFCRLTHTEITVSFYAHSKLHQI